MISCPSLCSMSLLLVLKGHKLTLPLGTGTSYGTSSKPSKRQCALTSHLWSILAFWWMTCYYKRSPLDTWFTAISLAATIVWASTEVVVVRSRADVETLDWFIVRSDKLINIWHKTFASWWCSCNGGDDCWTHEDFIMTDMTKNIACRLLFTSNIFAYSKSFRYFNSNGWLSKVLYRKYEKQQD